MMLVSVLAASVVLATHHPASVQKLECEPIKGIDGLMEAGASLLVGEVHGTVEIPRFVADVSCLALKRGLRVTLLLEASIEENDRFARYLASSGRTADRAALEAGEHWQSEFPDGRSSRAMLNMLETLRRQRSAGGDVVVLGIAGPPTRNAQDGDAIMAEHFLRARKADPTSFIVALAGGSHVQVRPGDDGVNHKWMGQYLVDAGLDRVVSLMVISGPGHYYNGQSQPRAVWPGRTDYGEHRFVRLGRWRPGHDGVFHVVTMTPSLPVSKRQAWGKR